MDTSELFDLARAELPRATEILCEWVAMGSVSARGEKLREGAELTARIARDEGFRVEVWETPGAPVVHAELPAPPGAPTVLFYGHYDVQPAEPLESWTAPPFAPQVRDGAVWGRGAGDNKGQLLPHLVAAGALHRAGRLPVGVRLLIEGEEEIGSPHLGTVVEERRDRLDADLAITADAPYHEGGRPLLIFGVRGLLYVEVRATGASRDLHSGDRGGWAPMPAWDLVRALAELYDRDGHVRIPGFLDDVVPPTAEETAMMEDLPLDVEAVAGDLGIARLAVSEGASPWEALMFRPTVSIAGLLAGYTGPGAKTVIPSTATAKLEMRLVADQDPERLMAALRDHFEARLESVHLERLAAVPPSATPADTPLAPAVGAAVAAATGMEPLRRPRIGGTTPDFVFTRILKLPSLLVPYGPPDMNHHAPDERMTLDALARGIRCSAAIMDAVGRHRT